MAGGRGEGGGGVTGREGRRSDGREGGRGGEGALAWEGGRVEEERVELLFLCVLFFVWVS